MTKKLPIEIGIRVRHRRDKRGGLVTGPAQHGISSPLIPVAVEGSTRKELWPSHLCARRPVGEQLPAHGEHLHAAQGLSACIHS